MILKGETGRRSAVAAGRRAGLAIGLSVTLLLGLLAGVSTAEEAGQAAALEEPDVMAQLEGQLAEVDVMIESFERLAEQSLARAQATDNFDLRTQYQEQHLRLRQAVSEMKAVEAEIRSALGELAADRNLEDSNVP